MANISTYLTRIKTAIYGEEVRGSIHDAIEAMNAESSSAMEFAAAAKDSAQSAAASAQTSASTAVQKAEEAVSSAQAAKRSESAAASKASEAVAAAQGIQASERTVEAAKNVVTAAKTAAENARDEAAASALSALQYSGKPPKPQNGTWWIWDAEQQRYADSGIGCELTGPAGTGVRDIRLTNGDHAPGTTDIYTVTLTDGTTTNISVYNGRNGTGSGDLSGISFDLTIPASGWLDGEATVADERLIALSTYKYFLGANEACRQEYRTCGVTPKDITTSGFITFSCSKTPTTDLAVNVIRLELAANGA